MHSRCCCSRTRGQIFVTVPPVAGPGSSTGDPPPPAGPGCAGMGVSAALALLQILGYEQCLCAPPLLLLQLLGALHVPSPREGTAGCCSSRGWPRCSPLGCDNVTAAQSPRRRPQLCQRAGGWGWGWAGPDPAAREGRRAPAHPSHRHSPSLAALTSFLSGSSTPLIHPGQMAASRGLLRSTRGARGCGGAAAQGSAAAAAALSPPKLPQCGPPKFAGTSWGWVLLVLPRQGLTGLCLARLIEFWAHLHR